MCGEKSSEPRPRGDIMSDMSVVSKKPKAVSAAVACEALGRIRKGPSFFLVRPQGFVQLGGDRFTPFLDFVNTRQR